MFRRNAGLRTLVSVVFATWIGAGRVSAEEWPLWKSYASAFLDNQVRVIDHDVRDRTTSEGQAYAMFFALVANDRARFDGLLRWTEVNLAEGDLTTHLPAWLWGRDDKNQWHVLDSNPAADADVWMAFTLLEAGQAWADSRYTAIGSAIAEQVAEREVAQIPGAGTVLVPAPSGFHKDDSYRLNASYVPMQVLIRLGHLLPEGPWQQIAEQVPALVGLSSPHGFATDWIEFKRGIAPKPSPLGSFDAIRVYLWAGMLDPATPRRDEVLKGLWGMAAYLQSIARPPAKVRQDGVVMDPNGPVGFSAAVLPYLAALNKPDSQNQQMQRVRLELNPSTGLYGNPPRYYDQNLALFAFGCLERRFWFSAEGRLQTTWKHD